MKSSPDCRSVWPNTTHNDETERDSTDEQRQGAPQPHEPQNDAATQEFMERLNEAQARLAQL